MSQKPLPQTEDTQPPDPVIDEPELEISDQHPDDHDRDTFSAGDVVLEEDEDLADAVSFDDDAPRREFEAGQ